MISPMSHHPALKLLSGLALDLPCPSSISSWWNFGSILGLCLMIQALSGVLLAMHYISSVGNAFESVAHISRDVNMGWFLRALHANGASVFFISLYLHMGRGIYYSSFSLSHTWLVGVSILLITMATAFMGYVLPWGQMSFWGATVITSLFSAVPYIGPELVSWIWGGFAIDEATLTRFFALHFFFPFLIMGGVAMHLMMLHQSGSLNPLGLPLSADKIPFHPYFTTKDLFGFSLVAFVLIFTVTMCPWVLGDPENFIAANPLVTPIHIQPEWYFLFAYAILRSIPNKLGGVIALVASVAVFYLFPLMASPLFKGLSFYPLSKSLFWGFISIILLLTWIGARPVEHPYVLVGQAISVLYFFYLPLFFYHKKVVDKFI